MPIMQEQLSAFHKHLISMICDSNQSTLSSYLKTLNKFPKLMKYNLNRVLITGLFIVIFLTCLAWLNKPVRAISRISLTVEKLLPDPASDEEIPDWLLKNLQIELDISGPTPILELHFDSGKLPEPLTELESVKLVCAVPILSADEFACQQGQLELFSSKKGLLDYSGNFSLGYIQAEQALKMSLNDLEIGSGKLDMALDMHAEEAGFGVWNVHLAAKNLNYIHIERFLKHYLKDEFKQLSDVSGRMSFTAQLSGQYAPDEFSLEQLKMNGQLKHIAYSQGDNLGDKLGFDFNLDFKTEEQRQFIKIKIDKPTGEFFQDPLYLSFSGQEVFSANVIYDIEKQQISVKNSSLHYPQLMDFKLQGLFAWKDRIDIRYMNSSLNIEDLSQLNQLYLQNILEGTDYEGLNIEGRVNLKAKQEQNIIEVNSNIDDVSIEFKEQISLSKLHGQVYWNSTEQHLKPVRESRLNWDKIELSGLPVGKSQLQFKTHHNQLSLNNETNLPIFDGALVINNLQVENFNDDLELTIDGIIEPVSLGLISAHFDWPILDGKLGAVIPATHYTNKQLSMGGAMMMQVFDGTIIIKDLMINEPLKETAQLTANIDLNQLDLQSLTSTYDFGEIQGRVEGQVRELKLDAWTPVAFDAYLRTPDKDKSKHRISQQAIDNLSSLGGASAILSKTFLSVFETFGYNKLGLSCKLTHGICEMNGIEDKGDAYYIVKGGGVPRIDVMGFQHRVDWNTLLERLAAIQSANQAVIE